MWPYDSGGFDPPAPVVEVSLVIGEDLRESARMLVDSGADLTCIPEHLVPSPPPPSYGTIFVAGYEGEITARRTHFVSIVFGEHRFENIEVLPIPSRLGLIGRDLLNSLLVTLDGPARKLRIDGH